MDEARRCEARHWLECWLHQPEVGALIGDRGARRIPVVAPRRTWDGGMAMFERCSWLNEPADWTMASDRLVAVTDHGTDFWRETHYGFVRDSGHFFGFEVSSG